MHIKEKYLFFHKEDILNDGICQIGFWSFAMFYGQVFLLQLIIIISKHFLKNNKGDIQHSKSTQIKVLKIIYMILIKIILLMWSFSNRWSKTKWTIFLCAIKCNEISPFMKEHEIKSLCSYNNVDQDESTLCIWWKWNWVLRSTRLLENQTIDSIKYCLI